MEKININKSNARHYTWGTGCESWVYTEGENLSVKHEKMPPGTKEQLHFHKKAQQFFFILSGEATFYLEGDKYIIAQESGILISPSQRHYIANESDQDIQFLVISQPDTVNDRTNIE
jgi:mannose-6-phosphate isomerase-like protein (cupin superfamily)